MRIILSLNSNSNSNDFLNSIKTGYSETIIFIWLNDEYCYFFEIFKHLYFKERLVQIL